MKFSLKNLCFVVLFFLIFPMSLYASKKATDVVKNIKIEGLVNYNQSIARDKIDIKKNQKINRDQVDTDIKSILATGYFVDAEARTEAVKGGINVIYKIKEKTMIGSLKFEGDKKIKASKLRDKIEIKEKSFYDEFALSKAKEAIIDFYKEQGYGDAKLDAVVDIDKTTNKASITIFITEGNILKLKNVLITGNKEFKTKLIFKTLGVKRKKIFKEDEYKKGLKQIEFLYKENGFLDIAITEKSRTFDEKRENVEINLEIKEGQKYTINEISFAGNTVFLPSEFLKLVLIKQGMIYKESLFEESMMNIQTLYSERGYIRATVKPDIEYKNNTVNIKFLITENNIVYVDKIFIEGNDITKDYVIRREFVIKEQEVFNVNKVRRTQERIFNLGFFKDIQMDLEPVDDSNVNLTFKVEEQPTGMATVGAGYSSQDGLIGNLQFTKNNLFGRGQRLNFLWEFGEKKQNYQIGFTEPYLFGTYTSFGADISDTDRSLDYVYKNINNNQTTDVYNDKHQGISFRFGRKFWDDYTANLTFGFEKSKIYNVDIDTSTEHQTLLDEENKGEQETNSVTFAVARDTRDNVFYTKHGTYTRLSVKNAGGILAGDNNFVKALLNHSRFYHLFWEFVLALNIDAGIVKPFDISAEVPLYEKFKIGGAESVRGYRYNSGDIGPQDGGLYKLVYNIEYKFPIIQEKKQSILQGALFFDVGGAWNNRSDIDLSIGRDKYQMKCGVGIGIRFTTPAFPIRLDWGYGFNKEDGKDPKELYFTIGQLF
jgi:outer membrane protein insertion porin family